MVNKDFFAVSTVSDFFMILIIESIFSTDTEIPNKICALSRAFAKSYLIFFIKVAFHLLR